MIHDGYWQNDLDSYANKILYWKRKINKLETLGIFYGNKDYDIACHRLTQAIFISAAIIRKIVEEENEFLAIAKKYNNAFKENKQVTNDFYVLFNFQITTYKLELKKEEIIDYYKTFFGDYCVKDYGLALNAKNSFLLKDVCNWIIHSYVWSLGDLQDERKISGFFVSSDRDKVKYCNYINIDDWAKALKHCAKNAYL